APKPPEGKAPRPAPKPGEGKPAAKPDEGKPAAKPVKKVSRERNWSSDGRRRLDQVLVDLGFIDDYQREELLDEARNSDSTIERVALDRGLVTEEQLLQAQAEAHGMKIVNLEEVKPQPAAINLVQEPMANLYKMLPLSYEDDVLTVAMADPNNLQAIDDLRNFLSIQNVQA